MSILAEPRRKQRISVDPRNLNWANDESKVSKKMMKKMGWGGGGLGRNEQGSNSHLNLRANRNQKGLGALESYDSTWIAHHDHFSDILAALNRNKQEAKEDETEEERAQRTTKMNMELTSKSLRRRIHYQKFTRAKDLSQYSEKDRAAIFGKTNEAKEGKEKEEPEREVEKEEERVVSNVFTTNTLSVADYFAAKMASLQKKPEQEETKVVDKKKEKKKRIKEEEIDEDTPNRNIETMEDEGQWEEVERKKDKKRIKEEAIEESPKKRNRETEEDEGQREEVERKKKKRGQEEEDVIERKQKRKKNKKHRRDEDEE